MIKCTPIICIKRINPWLKTIKQHDKNAWSVKKSSLVCAASEFIFSNISDLVKSAAVTLPIALQSKTSYEKAVDYTKNINLGK